MDDLEKYSDYAYGFIETICKDIGPRLSSSSEEQRANKWIQSEWVNYCDKAEIEEFSTKPNLYPQGILKVVFSIGLIAYSLNLLAYPYSIFASIFALITVIIFVAEFMLINGILKFFFKKGVSSNIYGIVKSVKEPKFKIILDGHTDSAIEMLWGRVRKISILITLGVFVGMYIGVHIVYPIIKLILQSTIIGHNVYWKWFIFEISYYDVIFLPIGFILLLFYIAFFSGLIGKKVVLGANDNLSGTAIASAVAKYFSNNKLSNVELIIISTGSEEIGEVGAEYFVKHHPEFFENSFSVAFECVGAGQNLFIVESDFMHQAKYSQKVVDYLEKAYEIYKKDNENAIPIKRGSLAMGSSNANRYAKAGYESTFIIGQSKEAPWRPVNWHSRYDTHEYIDKKVLKDILGTTIQFVKLLDEEFS
ncbi:MAG: M28 family peptidase [Candidatus Heimdallarchaeota archaeon]|nr:M28 family peptidase [Candidatus Heimdallarchaeota archaeon]